MKLRIAFLSLIGIFSIPSFGQQWEHVGPISTNQLPNNFGENKFETSQFNCLTINPNNSSHIFASGKFAGLWETRDAGENWLYVNTNVLGVTGVSDVMFIDENRIVVSSFYANEHYFGNDFSKSIGLYDFNQPGWTLLPLLSNSKHRVNKIDFINLNDGIKILAASSIGLYEYTLNSGFWNLLLNINAHTVNVIQSNNSSIVSCVGTQISNQTPNTLLYFCSANGGLSWLNPLILPASNVDYDLRHSKMDFKYSNNIAEFFIITDAYLNNAAHLKINKVTLNTANNILNSSMILDGTISGGRIAISYDPFLDIVWFGGQKLHAYCENCPVTFRHDIRESFHTNNGNIHDDIHSIKIVTIESSNYIYAAHDGGVARADLSNIAMPLTNFNQFDNNGTNHNIIFEPMNHGLNVMLVYGFSGSFKNPYHYVAGGHDIVQTDFYNSEQQRNVHTQFTWENDGGHIDLFDDNLTIFDVDSYNYIGGYKVANVNYENGNFNFLNSGNQHQYKEPLMPQGNNPISSIIQANMLENVSLNNQAFTSRNWIQDSYRPNRLFFIYHKKGLFQYDYNNHVFVRKLNLSEMNPELVWGGWSDGWRNIKGVSFSPDTPNSMYIIADGNEDDEVKHPLVIKFVGQNLDFTYGLNHTRYGTDGLPNWELISQSLWSNFNSLTNCNLSNEDLINFELVDIETSLFDKDIIYVLMRHKDCSNLKIVKYENGVWTNYSQGLPDVEYSNRMIMDRMSNDCIYLSTTAGLFYRTRDMSAFIPFIDENLPKLRINQMEVNYTENTLRVGTFGLGIWKSNLVCPDLDNLVFNNPIPGGYYEARFIEINSANQPSQTEPRVFRATNSIEFNPGFNSSSYEQIGRYTHAFIHGCDSWGSSRNFIDYSMMDDSRIVNSAPDLSNEIQLFPNPNSGSFKLRLPKPDFFQIEIYSIIGTVIYSEMIQTERNEVEVNSNLPVGVYIAVMRNESFSKAIKFIVSN